MSSRQTRSSIGRNGVREVIFSRRTSTEEMGWFGKLWTKVTGKVVQWGKSFAGWLWEGLTKFFSSFSFEKVATFITSNWDSFWNFNWNISDEQIDKNMMNIANQFISTTAGFLGNMAGKLVCGVLPTIGIAFINKAAAMHIALSKGPEMLMEVSTAFGAYVKQSFNMAMKAIAWQLFKHGRRVVKMFLDKSPSTLATAIVSMVPGGKGTIEKWGDEKGEEWSFGKQRREAREKLPEKYDGAFKAGREVSEILDYLGFETEEKYEKLKTAFTPEAESFEELLEPNESKVKITNQKNAKETLQTALNQIKEIFSIVRAQGTLQVNGNDPSKDILADLTRLYDSMKKQDDIREQETKKVQELLKKDFPDIKIETELIDGDNPLRGTL
ncbi:hypothetical protein [Limnospira platensis]|uniref:hypothetical protein n=1 Tax=Limnospira platensis TaxID=118562 RepID=UPI003D6FB020